MSAVPSPVADTLRALTDAVEKILRSNLVGVYIYGSLTQGTFDPARSDVDCLVVVHRDLTQAQVRQLRAWLARAARTNSWIPRVQMQLLRRAWLLRPDARGYLYQFGKLRRSGSDGNPIVWMNVLATGVTLAGPAAETFLPPITGDMFFDALVREVGYLRAEITDPASEWRGRTFYRAYAVLTLCRILYSYRKGGVVSKPRAARWALRTLPTKWHSLIREAVTSDRGKSARLPLPRIAHFMEFVEGQLVS
jgi:predicted nucleotidyltransferase